MKRNLIRCVCWLILFSICLIAGCNSPANESPALTPKPDIQATPTQTASGGNVNAGEPTAEPTKEVLLVEKLKYMKLAVLILPCTNISKDILSIAKAKALTYRI